jgi:chemotaxis protein MotB
MLKAKAIEQERLLKAHNFTRVENLIAAKEATMRKLETLSNALNGFEGKGLTVEQKTVKYILWRTNCFLTVIAGSEGKKAVVELGKVLGENPDIAVLIEGHTDNDPYVIRTYCRQLGFID